MNDLGRLWRLFVSAIHGTFSFVDGFASSSPIQLGYVLLVLGTLVLMYRKRRIFYGVSGANAWNPSYGNIVAWTAFDRLLGLTIWAIIFLGLMVLFRWYLPDLFTGISGFFIAITS